MKHRSDSLPFYYNTDSIPFYWYWQGWKWHNKSTERLTRRERHKLHWLRKEERQNNALAMSRRARRTDPLTCHIPEWWVRKERKRRRKEEYIRSVVNHTVCPFMRKEHLKGTMFQEPSDDFDKKSERRFKWKMRGRWALTSLLSAFLAAGITAALMR